jgi:hypothetical protein
MSNWIKSSWRWIGVLLHFIVLISNYLIMPLLDIKHSTIPTGYWTFMTFYFTNYIESRGFEKVKGVEQ